MLSLGKKRDPEYMHHHMTLRGYPERYTPKIPENSPFWVPFGDHFFVFLGSFGAPFFQRCQNLSWPLFTFMSWAYLLKIWATALNTPRRYDFCKKKRCAKNAPKPFSLRHILAHINGLEDILVT